MSQDSQGNTPATTGNPLVAGLNPQQAEAVRTIEGPVLILAGAGSGKTKALTHRFANIILSESAYPHEILCVTFTNKAAKEMEHRISIILDKLGIGGFVPSSRSWSRADALWISTFHSFCIRVLRRHPERIGFRAGFGIYDDADQLSTIKKILTALNINDKMFPAKMFRARIHRAKMMGLNAARAAQSPAFGHDPKTLEVFKRYEEDLRAANAMDFEDLLLKTYELLKENEDVLHDYQRHFRFIMVDEYQDTNHIQYLLIQLLASGHRNLCVVGDEDQSIYSWRGADISNILDFEKDFPEAKVIKLEENYRSSGHVVKAASAVISKNTERKAKTLFTNNPDGERITVREERSEYDEARWVAKSIQQLLQETDTSAAEIAVFYRTNAQSRVLEEQMRTTGIPYRLFGGVRFYERQEIKDVIGYFRLAVNPSDDAAFRRVINTPARGIGKATVEKLEELASARRASLLTMTPIAVDQREFNSGTCSKLRAFVALIAELQQQVEALSLLEFYQLVLEKTEYLARLKAEATPEAESRVENLREFGNALDQFAKERPDASMVSFLEEMSLASDLDQKQAEGDAVTLMTLHLSKGLEFPYVYIVGMEENLFPSNRNEDTEQADASMEEERRLAYVGMTRAKKKLHLLHARARKVWGQDQFNPPSRFLAEIPPEFIETTSALEMSPFLKRMSERYGDGSTGYDPGVTARGGASYGSDQGRGGGLAGRRGGPGIDRSGYNRPSAPRNSFRKPGGDDDAQAFPDYDGDTGGAAGDGYHKGQRVRHPTFGAGTIYLIEGAGDQEKISVLFEDQSLRKFVTKYARLERI